MKVKQYSAVCAICKKEISASTELGLKQALGFHKSRWHNIPGVTSTVESKRIYSREKYWHKMGYTPEEIALKRKQYEAKDAFGLTRNHPIPDEGEPPKRPRPQTTRTAEPLALNECPCCGARFFVTKKGQQ